MRIFASIIFCLLTYCCFLLHCSTCHAATQTSSVGDILPIVSQQSSKLPVVWKFVGDGWTVKPFTHHEVISKATVAVASQHHVAFPGICKTNSGNLLVVYREAYTHASGKADDGRVMLVRSGDSGKTWSEPSLITDDSTMDDRNAAVSCMDDGTICVIYDKYLSNKHHWAWMVASSDEGRTWSQPVKVSKTEDVHTRSRALDLGEGKWLIPYSESTESPTAASFFSIYDSKTGQFEEIAATPRGNRNLADETAVTATADGRLVALVRSNVDPQLFQITSSDGGRTWTAPVKSGIPSQFTPADLVTLDNGWLVAGFSFRDRRDERLAVSRDGGNTWDVENSLDVFDGTRAVGSDRSYPASVQLDENTVGTVLYETQASPQGGKILFVTTKIDQFDASKQNTLYQSDADAEAAFAIWPKSDKNNPIGFEYRFTGKFGDPPNIVGLLLEFKDQNNYTSLEYQMGSPANRDQAVVNRVQLVSCVEGNCTSSNVQTAAGDWFQDGNFHRLTVETDGDRKVFKIDGYTQFVLPDAAGEPCGIITRRAAVSITGLVVSVNFEN